MDTTQWLNKNDALPKKQTQDMHRSIIVSVGKMGPDAGRA